MSDNVTRFPGRPRPVAAAETKPVRLEDRLPRASEVGRLDLVNVPRKALEHLTSSLQRLNEVNGRAADHKIITDIIAMRTGVSDAIALDAALQVIYWLMTGEQRPTPPEAA
jgi:hypothetical protein